MESEEIEDVLIIEDRESKIEQLIHDLLSGTKTLSYSSLKAFRDSPSDFIEYCLKEKKDTEAMFFGRVLHCLVLEPSEFPNRYFVLNDTEKVAEIGGGNPRLTKVYKEWKSEKIALNPNKECVKNDMFINASVIANNVLYNRASAKVLSLCPESEKEINWEFKNFKFRGFIDKDGNKAMADLKLMKSATPRAAQRTIIDMWYYGQAAMYLRAKGLILPYYVIAVDRHGGVSVHKLHKHLIEQGLEEYERLIDKFNDCMINGNFNQSYDFWADSYDGIFTAEKPAFMY